MKTKKEIKKQYKKCKKIVKKAKIVESIDRSHKTFVPHFDVKYIADDRGWYKNVTLTASEGGTWTKDLVSKPVVILEYFDGDCVLNLEYNHDSYKLEFPLFVLHDISVAASVLNEFNDNHMFNKVKMKKKK